MDELPQMEPEIGEREREAVDEYLRSGGWLTEYERTRALEERLAAIVGVDDAWMTPNGTLSLVLAVDALDLPPDAEVLVPDLTMIATANAVRYAGATPVLVDVDPETFCMDVADAERALTDDTGAMLYVSLNGRAGHVEEIAEFADEHDLALVEDAAQSLGSTVGGRPLGSIGDVGCLSFSYAKIVTTGQGGAIVTDDDELSERVRKLRDFGREENGVDEHPEFGINGKFTDLQAVVGAAQLDRFDDRVEYKRWLFERYRSRLADVDGVVVPETDTSETAPWFVDVLFEDGATRDAVADGLERRGIHTRPFYPPVHTQGPYADDVDRSYPAATSVSERGLWLPSSFDLSERDVDRVCSAIRDLLPVEA